MTNPGSAYSLAQRLGLFLEGGGAPKSDTGPSSENSNNDAGGTDPSQRNDRGDLVKRATVDGVGNFAKMFDQPPPHEPIVSQPDPEPPPMPPPELPSEPDV